MTNVNPFDTIESALEFLTLFDAVIGETLTDIRKDLGTEEASTRRADAMRLAIYKLEKLDHHITRSRRMANDLRIIRRLLFEERTGGEKALAASVKA